LLAVWQRLRVVARGQNDAYLTNSSSGCAVSWTLLTDTYGPSYAVARPALHTLLAKALPSSVDVLLGTPVTAVRQSGRTVAVTWPGGDGNCRAPGGLVV